MRIYPSVYCNDGRILQVLESSNGYYIGTFCNGPYCRLSDCYFQSKQTAQKCLETLSFPVRHNSAEIKYCSGGKCI